MEQDQIEFEYQAYFNGSNIHVKRKSIIFIWLPLPILGQKQYTKDVERFVQYLKTDSKVLMNAKDGPNGLSKDELCNIIPMIFGVAAFAGTRDLATRPMCIQQKNEIMTKHDAVLKHQAKE